MIHRHLQVHPDTAVEALPSAAIVDLLERGDLAQWQPIATAIAYDPTGEFSERVMRLLDAYPMYGTSPLWRSWIDRCRARAEGSRRPWAEASLATLRRQLGFTQARLAGGVGMSQSDLSKFERRRDVRLSTLRAYVEALGGRLRILFESDSNQAEIRLPSLDSPRR